MRLSSVFTEGWRNFATATFRTVGVGGALCLILALLAVADMRSSASLIEAAARFQSSGGATTLVLAEGYVDGRACDRLAEASGIQSSGALRRVSDLRLAVFPSSGVPTYESSPGFSSLILGWTPSTEGILVSGALGASLNASPGLVLDVDGADATIGGVFAYPVDGRRADLEYSILLPTPTIGSFDQCWVKAWPIPKNLDSIVRLSLSPDMPRDTQPEIRQLNSTLGTDFDGAGLYTARPFRLVSVVALAAGLLIALASVFRRRIEFASLLHAGVSKSALAAQVGVESLLIGLVPMLAVAAAVLVTTVDIPLVDRGAVQMAGIGVALCGVGGYVLGSIIASLLVRESALFRYFKSR